MPARLSLPTRFVSAQFFADVAVIVVNYNTGHLLPRCIGHLRCAIDGLRVQLIVVDNASRDDSLAVMRELIPDGTVIANPENIGFGRANNQALASCHARYVLLLNADAYVNSDALRLSVDYMDAHSQCGVLGAHLVDEDGRGVFSGRPFPKPWANFLLQTGLSLSDDSARAGPMPAGPQQCDWVVGCFYLVRKAVLDQVGLFDPRYFLYFEEVDHCLAVKQAGWDVVCLTDARVVHVGGGSAETEGALGAGRQISAFQVESSLLYFRKHNGLLGVFWTAGLAVLTELILGLKWLLLRRRLRGLGSFWRRARLVCRLMVDTRVGAVPTR